MEKTELNRARTVGFWDGYAKWYKQWTDHNDYHGRIFRVLSWLAEPGWKVLDVGAGSGILAKALYGKECHVTALEPSSGMRRLMEEGMEDEEARGIVIDNRRLEDLSLQEVGNHDMVVACNSLHLTQMGFVESLKTLFDAGPKRIFVVTELLAPRIRIPIRWRGYQMAFGRIACVESSFAYHSAAEAKNHWASRKGRFPNAKERRLLMSSLVCAEEHYWMKDAIPVGMFCWHALFS